MSLSDKRLGCYDSYVFSKNPMDNEDIYYPQKDVKEAVKELKRILMECGEVNECNDVDSQMIYIGEIFEKIDKIFGPALTEEKKN